MKTLGKDGPHPLDMFRKVIEVNLIGTFNMIRLVADRIAKLDPLDGGERGVIVNTASIAAYDGQIGQAAYSSSKGGVVGMTLPVARELARIGIRVMTIAPGIFKTPMMMGTAAGGAGFARRIGAVSRRASASRRNMPRSRSTSSSNQMLNGETIRLDGAIAHGAAIEELSGSCPPTSPAAKARSARRPDRHRDGRARTGANGRADASEMGADVLRIERMHVDKPFLKLAAGIRSRPPRPLDPAPRPRSVPKAATSCCGLREKADVLIEGFRPGVMERLGLGPDETLRRNPALIYGRMTGFGQEGPLAGRAGHDLTYLAYSGILNAIGPKGGKPVPPLNLIGDYGGGTMFLIAGILAAAVRAVAIRQGPGRRRRHDRRRVDARRALLRLHGGWPLARPPRLEPARFRRALLRHL